MPYPDDGRPFGEGVFPTPSGRVELVNERMAAHGPTGRCPTTAPPARAPAATPRSLERYPLQLLTAKWHTRFLNTSYSHLPKHGPAEGGPFVELSAADADGRGLVRRRHRPECSTTGPASSCRCASTAESVTASCWCRSAGGTHQHPDGRTANALTNATLTDWGGGVAYSDTLVEVEPITVVA